MLTPYIEKWPQVSTHPPYTQHTPSHLHTHTHQAMALKAYPPVAPTALENLSLMVDDIWYMAGDKSTDFNWYTKRAILAAIYTSTGVWCVCVCVW